MTPPTTPTETAATRPRVEGDREAEILDATLEVLVDVGYDRLTMDAVALRAQASKATLYRRWNTKVRLVIDALLATKQAPTVPDTGSLRGDLIELFCGIGGVDRRRGGRHCSPACSPPSAATRSSPRRSGARSSAPRSRSPSRSGSAPSRAARSAPDARPVPVRAGPRRDRAAPRLPAGRAAHRGPRHPGDRPDHPARRDARPTSREATHDDTTVTERRDTERARPPARQLHLGWALVLISVAQLMVVLDATIANIALPYIGADLDISQANLTWIVTGYALAFGGLLLLGGRLGDLYGRRRIFMIGLAIFAVASLLGGLAQSEALLLASRGLQGFGAALASPAALALITTTFPAGPAAQPGLRGLRRHVRRRRRRRPDPRRLADRPRQRVRHRDRAAGG